MKVTIVVATTVFLLGIVSIANLNGGIYQDANAVQDQVPPAAPQPPPARTAEQFQVPSDTQQR